MAIMRRWFNSNWKKKTVKRGYIALIGNRSYKFFVGNELLYESFRTVLLRLQVLLHPDSSAPSALRSCLSVVGGVGWAPPIQRHPPHSNKQRAAKLREEQSRRSLMHETPG